MLQHSKEVFKAINPVVEERNRRAKLMNQIGEVKNKIMDVQKAMESDPKHVSEKVNEQTRSLDKKPTDDLEKVLGSLQETYDSLCAETNIFIPTDFSSSRFVKSMKDGKQAVFDEKHNKVGEAFFKNGKMVGEYIEHNLNNYDELKSYFNTSSYVVDSSVKYSEETKCFEKTFFYSIRRNDVEGLSKPIDPLAIIEVGYDEHERIKYIRRIIHNRYIDKASFDENGNLLRIHYNIREQNGHYHPHSIVYRRNGQLKYYINEDRFLVEWGSTTRADANDSFSTIRAFGDYRLEPNSNGKICVEIESKEGEAVYFNEYYYAFFRRGQIGPKNIDKPDVKKEGENLVVEKKRMPVLLDTTTSHLEERMIGSLETVPGGYISSFYSYSSTPYYQEYRSDSKDVVASVSYLVPIDNEEMPLMAIIYNDGKRRVLQKNGNVPPSLLKDVIDDGHNCDLERIKKLFFDFTSTGYEGLDTSIPVYDTNRDHLPEDVPNHKDAVSEGEIDEAPSNAISDEVNPNPYPSRDSVDRRPEDSFIDKDAMSEGEIDEVTSNAISDEVNPDLYSSRDSVDRRPEDSFNDKDSVDDGAIDEVLNESISEEKNRDLHHEHRHLNPLPEVTFNKEEDAVSEGSIDEVISDAISEGANSKDEGNQVQIIKSIAVDARPEEMIKEEEVHEVNKKPIDVSEDDLDESKVNATQSDHQEIDDSGAIDRTNASAQPHLYV